MTQLRVLSAWEFTIIATRRNRLVKMARLRLTCDLCKGKGRRGRVCVGCDDMKEATIELPVLVVQSLPDEIFQKIIQAMRKADEFYG